MMMVYHCHGDDVNQKWMLGWFSLFSSNRSSLPCTTRPETSASSNLLVFHSAHVTRCHNVTMVAGLLSLAPQSVALSRLAFRVIDSSHQGTGRQYPFLFFFLDVFLLILSYMCYAINIRHGIWRPLIFRKLRFLTHCDGWSLPQWISPDAAELPTVAHARKQRIFAEYSGNKLVLLLFYS